MFDRVLGVDPGLSRCGYGLVERHAGIPHAVAHGVMRTSPDAPLPERLATLQADIEALFAEHRPAVVAVERLFFQVNVRTAMAVGQASGIVLAAAARAGIPVHQYTPNEVKQAVTGYGAAPKAQVRAMVTALLHLAEPPRPADASDALALALCHCTVGALRARVDAALGAPGRIGDAMIGSVRGTVLDRTTAGEVLVEVGGVGYRLHVPTRVLGAYRLGAEVFAWTSHYVREDAVALYGFATREERDVFEALLGATGVGPKLALAILSVLGPDDLRRVLVDDDTEALCAVPGVGKKTAQRLLLDLKSRLAVPDLEVVRNGAARSARAEVRDALAGLGYGPDEIRVLLAELDPGDDASPEVLLREALRVAARERRA